MTVGRSAALPWWRGGIIYQIYPRSFQDSTGNGVGDLNGITRRLDYIAELGVDAVWLSPVFQSPMADFGYDISDYRKIDPLFGTSEDFDQLIDRAHSLGLKVLIDQVWSHTSDQHVWFEESRPSKINARADWYVWADAKPDGSPPNNWLSVFGGPAWTWDTRRMQYYLHNFLKQQPDLNFHNPEVQNEILEVARYWLDRGIDGFRIDACSFYFHDQQLRDNPPRPGYQTQANPHDWQSHIYCRSRPENLEFIAKLRRLTDKYEDVCIMGEIGDNNGMAKIIEYTEGNSRLHTAYSFDLLFDDSSARNLHQKINTWARAQKGYPSWALGNHDVPRVATRWSQGKPSAEKTRLFFAFQASLPAILCVYQGEELGLEQAYVPYERLQDPDGKTFWPLKPGRDGCRTPMPWLEDKPMGGFTDADDAWLPQPTEHRANSVQSQTDVGDSTLSFYKELIALRNKVKALKYGAMALLTEHEQLLGFTRTHEGDEYLCVFNFSDSAADLEHEKTISSALRSENCQLSEHAKLEFNPWGWGIFQISQ